MSITDLIRRIAWGRTRAESLALSRAEARAREGRRSAIGADEVLIDGFYIPREDLPRVAENFARSANEAHRDAKRMYLRAEKAERERDELLAVLVELERRKN